MLRTCLFAILLTAAVEAGSQTLDCYDSERFGNILINVGDSERRVLEQEPDREVRLENRFGATSGWRYDFYKRNRTIQIYVRHGVVYRICRVPE
jgi:hypothetical protein